MWTAGRYSSQRVKNHHAEKEIETFYNIDISERNIVDAFSECLGSLPSGKYVPEG